MLHYNSTNLNAKSNIVDFESHNNNSTQPTTPVKPNNTDHQISKIITGNNLGSVSTLQNDLAKAHIDEFLASGWDRSLIRANVRTIRNASEIAEHLNLTEPWQFKWYGSVLVNGGWLCGFAFKPDKPRQTNGRVVKYENPSRGGAPTTRHTLLDVPHDLASKIADRFNIPYTRGTDFWTWVENHPQIPVAHVEGVKNAGAVICKLLMPAIAYNGHSMSYHAAPSQDALVPEFLQHKRINYLCFDQDSNPSTRKAVTTTIAIIATRLRNKTALKCVQWNTPHKAIDDLLTTESLETVKSYFTKAISADDVVDTSYNMLGYEPSYVFSSKRWIEPEEELTNLLTCLKGEKGTGKTWQLQQLIRKAMIDKRPVVSVSHRIELARDLSLRLTLTFIQDSEEKVAETTNLSLCIDSLWKINPENFKGAVVVIDEVVQVLEHLNESDTCKNKRSLIIKTLRRLAQIVRESGGQFVIADADLNKATIDYFLKLLGNDFAPDIIVNEYKETSYKCYITNGYIDEKKRHTKARRTPTDIVSAALTKATNGERIFIYTTGQKDDARWGTKTLERLFIATGILPSTICRIDSDTVKDPEHPAFKAGSRINEICDSFAIIIASPTIATGCSIENQKPFDAFFGLFMGVGSTDCARQALMRLRDKSVTRYVFIAEHGTPPNGFGKTQKAVEEYIAKLWLEENRSLNQYETDWNYGYDQVDYDQRTAEYVNELYAVRNSQASDYKKYFKQGLRSEAVEVIEVEMLDSVLPCHYDFNDLLVQTKFIKEAAKAERNEEFSEQPKLDAENVQKLKKQTEITQNERILLDANLIMQRYQTEKLTPELVEKDLTSDYYDQIRLHYACTDEGWAVVQKLKFLWAFSQVDKNAGTVLQHDFIRNRLVLKAELIRESNILSLLDDPAKQIHQYDEQTLYVYQFIANNWDRIITILGIDFGKRKTKPSPDKFEIGLLKKVFGMMGIYLEENETKKKINGKTRRTYHVVCETEVITNPNKTEEISVYLGIDRERDKIFTKWLIRDIERAKNWDLKKETFINQRDAAKIHSSMSLDDLLEFQSQSHYKDLWELVDTDTRIALINRQDNYQLPSPVIQFVDPCADSYQAILADISTWDTFAIDLETFGNDVANKKGVRKEGLHARKGHIRLIQISDGKTIYIIDLGSRTSDRSAIQLQLQAVLDLLNRKLQNPYVIKIGHNIHFDLRFLRFQLNFGRAQNVRDTMKGVQIFFGDYGGLGVLPGGYGLGNLCPKLLGITIDKSEQKSDWGSDELTPNQIRYAALDSFYTYYVHDRIEALYQNPAKFGFSKLAQDGIRAAWQLENEVIPCAVELENNGLPINRELALSNLEKCLAIQRELLTQWTDLVPDVKYTQTPALKKWLNNKYKLAIKSLDKAKLADLKELPEIKLLSKLRAIQTPIQQLESLLRSSESTGRVQTVFKTLTGTGRFSSGDSNNFQDLPNLQSISTKDNPALKGLEIPKVRSCIQPKNGRGFAVIDLAGSHLRIAADLAYDETAASGLNDESIDNHSKVAEFVAKSLEQNISWQEIQNNKKIQPFKGYRDTAKNTVYGWINDASGKRVQEQIQSNSGDNVDIEACIGALEGCDNLFPGIRNYKTALETRLQQPENNITIDGKQWVINRIDRVNNRIIHAFDNDRVPRPKALAATWSRVEATALKKSLIEITKLAENNPIWNLKIINYVHDELNFEFDLQYAEVIITTVNNIIGDNFQKTLTIVKDGRETDWTKLLVENWSQK